MKDGVTYTDQVGVPVLYVGSPSGINHVEVDHLWLGDNGQHFNYAVWGPGGPGVLGSADQVDALNFHDLKIVTNYLCGLNMDSRTNGFSIYNVVVQSNGGNHGFYLAGYGSNGDIHDNHFIGTVPMRIGITIKAKNNIRLHNNEVTNAWFQGISTSGDAAFLTSTNVAIANNWIHDLISPGTSGITIFNASNVTITGNRIANVSWAGIYLAAFLWRVADVTISDNIISRVGTAAPVAGIVAKYVAPEASKSLSPGLLRNIVIEDNVINDSRAGIYVFNIDGTNLIRRNRIENNDRAQKCEMGYDVDSLSSSKTEFSNNVGPRCTHHFVGTQIISSGNTLK